MMSSRSRMTHRMTVVRNMEGTPKSTGEPTLTRTTLHTALPCDAWERNEKYLTDADKTVNVKIRGALVPFGTDIIEGDLVTAIRSKRGDVLFASGDYRVNAVMAVPKRYLIVEMEGAS